MDIRPHRFGIRRFFRWLVVGGALIGGVNGAMSKKPPVDLDVDSRCRGANCTLIIKAPNEIDFLANHPRLEAVPDCKILDVDVARRALRAQILESEGHCDLTLHYLDKDWSLKIE
jgi:hypothetical protein